jgi:hypothetical protein
MRQAVMLLVGLLSAWLMWQEVPSPPEWGLKSDWTIKGSYTTYEDCVGDLGRFEDLWRSRPHLVRERQAGQLSIIGPKGLPSWRYIYLPETIDPRK